MYSAIAIVCYQLVQLYLNNVIFHTLLWSHYYVVAPSVYMVFARWRNSETTQYNRREPHLKN